jgi:phage tail sheath gpL-like
VCSSDLYASYISTLDGIQTETGGSEESYIPNAEAQTALAQLVVESIAGVLQIALNSQQERTVTLTTDSDIINLTHRFYGLDSVDENIDRLINTNGWGLSQMLVVRANTPVTYYVG